MIEKNKSIYKWPNSWKPVKMPLNPELSSKIPVARTIFFTLRQAPPLCATPAKNYFTL